MVLGMSNALCFDVKMLQGWAVWSIFEFSVWVW